MANEDFEKGLHWLQNDFTRVEGKPFQHFYCPLMMSDEPTELCVAHVMPKCLPDTSRLCVIQRKDIDGFYGSYAEADFATMVEASKKGMNGIIRDRALLKKIKPSLHVGGKKVDYYPYQGTVAANQTHFTFQPNDGCHPVELVLKIPMAEALAAQSQPWSWIFEFDCTVATLVTLIKAAYLTLFRLHGYKWALSPGGKSIGYALLGEFFRENRSKEPEEIKAALRKTFLRYKNLVRPVKSFTPGLQSPGIQRKGTLNDFQSGVCIGASGQFFAEIILIRIAKHFFGVFLPAFDNATSAGAYFDFLQNSNETLRVHRTQFDPVNNKFHMEKNPMDVHWPKGEDGFELEQPSGVFIRT